MTSSIECVLCNASEHMCKSGSDVKLEMGVKFTLMRYTKFVGMEKPRSRNTAN
jgi:hypothetical protein